MSSSSSSTAASIPASVVDTSTPRSYNRISVNINGVVKRVLVPVGTARSTVATETSTVVSKVMLVKQSSVSSTTVAAAARGRSTRRILTSADGLRGGVRTIAAKTLAMPATQFIPISLPVTSGDPRPASRIPLQMSASLIGGTSAVLAASRSLATTAPLISRQTVLLRPISAAQLRMPQIFASAQTSAVTSNPLVGFRPPVSSAASNAARAQTVTVLPLTPAAHVPNAAQTVRAMLISKLTTMPSQRSIVNDASKVGIQSTVGPQEAAAAATAEVSDALWPTTSALSSSSASGPLTVIVNPRTLTTEEAQAVGWANVCQSSFGTNLFNLIDFTKHSGDRSLDGATTDTFNDVPSERLPHIMASVAAESELVRPSDVTSTDTCSTLPMEQPMNVIEIFPDDDMDAGVYFENDDSKDDKKFVLANEFTDLSSTTDVFHTSFVNNRRANKPQQSCSASSMSEMSRPESTTSTETAYSELEAEQISTSASDERDYVVLAEWWDNDRKQQLENVRRGQVRGEKNAVKPKGRKRRRRRKRKPFVKRALPPDISTNSIHHCVDLRSVPSGSVNKARRSAGRPVSAADRFGIRECFVSLERLTLRRGVSTICSRAYWKYICCREKNRPAKKPKPPASCDARASSDTLQELRVERAGGEQFTDPPTAPVNDLIVDGKESDGASLSPSFIEPKSITAAQFCDDGKPTPVAVASACRGASVVSMAGGVPILLRSRTGDRRGRVMVARPVSGSTNIKNKFLLVRTRTGSYLVPMDDGGTGKTLSAVNELIRVHHQQQPQQSTLSHGKPLTLPLAASNLLSAVSRSTETVQPVLRVKQETRSLDEHSNSIARPIMSSLQQQVTLATAQVGLDDSGVDDHQVASSLPVEIVVPEKRTAGADTPVAAEEAAAIRQGPFESKNARQKHIEKLKMLIQQGEEKISEIRRQQEVKRVAAAANYDTV